MNVSSNMQTLLNAVDAHIGEVKSKSTNLSKHLSVSQMLLAAACVQPFGTASVSNQLAGLSNLQKLITAPKSSANVNPKETLISGPYAPVIKTQVGRMPKQTLIAELHEQSSKPQNEAAHEFKHVVPESSSSSKPFGQLSDYDLKVLLANFFNLESNERIKLLCYCENIGQSDPKRFEQIKDFVNWNTHDLNADDIDSCLDILPTDISEVYEDDAKEEPTESAPSQIMTTLSTLETSPVNTTVNNVKNTRKLKKMRYLSPNEKLLILRTILKYILDKKPLEENNLDIAKTQKDDSLKPMTNADYFNPFGNKYTEVQFSNNEICFYKLGINSYEDLETYCRSKALPNDLKIYFDKNRNMKYLLHYILRSINDSLSEANATSNAHHSSTVEENNFFICPELIENDWEHVVESLATVFYDDATLEIDAKTEYKHNHDCDMINKLDKALDRILQRLKLGIEKLKEYKEKHAMKSTIQNKKFKAIHAPPNTLHGTSINSFKTGPKNTLQKILPKDISKVYEDDAEEEPSESAPSQIMTTASTSETFPVNVTTNKVFENTSELEKQRNLSPIQKLLILRTILKYILDNNPFEENNLDTVETEKDDSLKPIKYNVYFNSIKNKYMVNFSIHESSFYKLRINSFEELDKYCKSNTLPYYLKIYLDENRSINRILRYILKRTNQRIIEKANATSNVHNQNVCHSSTTEKTVLNNILTSPKIITKNFQAIVERLATVFYEVSTIDTTTEHNSNNDCDIIIKLEEALNKKLQVLKILPANISEVLKRTESAPPQIMTTSSTSETVPINANSNKVSENSNELEKKRFLSPIQKMLIVRTFLKYILDKKQLEENNLDTVDTQKDFNPIRNKYNEVQFSSKESVFFKFGINSFEDLEAYCKSKALPNDLKKYFDENRGMKNLLDFILKRTNQRIIEKANATSNIHNQNVCHSSTAETTVLNNLLSIPKFIEKHFGSIVAKFKTVFNKVPTENETNTENKLNNDCDIIIKLENALGKLSTQLINNMDKQRDRNKERFIEFKKQKSKEHAINSTKYINTNSFKSGPKNTFQKSNATNVNSNILNKNVLKTNPKKSLQTPKGKNINSKTDKNTLKTVPKNSKNVKVNSNTKNIKNLQTFPKKSFEKLQNVNVSSNFSNNSKTKSNIQTGGGTTIKKNMTKETTSTPNKISTNEINSSSGKSHSTDSKTIENKPAVKPKRRRNKGVKANAKFKRWKWLKGKLWKGIIEDEHLEEYLTKFFKLKTVEQGNLITHLKQLETTNPERVKSLRQYAQVIPPELKVDTPNKINSLNHDGEQLYNPEDAFSDEEDGPNFSATEDATDMDLNDNVPLSPNIDSDEDYNIEDVVQSALNKVNVDTVVEMESDDTNVNVAKMLIDQFKQSVNSGHPDKIATIQENYQYSEYNNEQSCTEMNQYLPSTNNISQYSSVHSEYSQPINQHNVPNYNQVNYSTQSNHLYPNNSFSRCNFTQVYTRRDNYPSNTTFKYQTSQALPMFSRRTSIPSAPGYNAFSIQDNNSNSTVTSRFIGDNSTNSFPANSNYNYFGS